MEHHIDNFHALAAELKSRKWLGWDEEKCPLAEVLFTASGPEVRQGLDLVPHEGHDPATLDTIVDFCEKWNWGGRKPPKVRLANPWREPNE